MILLEGEPPTHGRQVVLLLLDEFGTRRSVVFDVPDDAGGRDLLRVMSHLAENLKLPDVFTRYFAPATAALLARPDAFAPTDQGPSA